MIDSPVIQTDPLPLPLRRRRVGRRAFSLVEVVLALGIIAFALLTVMGLMPVGMQTMRDAMDNTTESQILRKVTAEALLTPFSQIGTNYAGKTFYYDEEGTILASTPGVDPVTTRYWVTTSVSPPIYPGSTNAVVTKSLTSMKIVIVTGASATATNKRTSIYNVQIPNSGN